MPITRCQLSISLYLWVVSYIIKRIKQFFRAISAKLSADDNIYISTHLSPAEQKLFFAMDVVDQCHSLRVAYTIERFVIEDTQGVDRDFLIRCALLHDIGRVKGDMSLFGKVFVVLVSAFFPSFADSLELKGSHLLYIYRHHAEIGAKKLQDIGLYKEAKIIARHHSPSADSDPRELKLLRIADDKN